MKLIAAAAVSAFLVAGSASAQTPGWCRAGAPLNVLWQGTWYAAHAKAAGPGAACLIGYDGYGANWDERVGADRAAPARSRTTYAAAGGVGQAISPARLSAPPGTGRIKVGRYHCVMFVGSLASGYLVNAPSIDVGDGGRAYRHEQGSHGELSLSADSTVSFHHGALDGQAAKYEPSSGGRAVMRIYNESRSRTVIDCDGPPN